MNHWTDAELKRAANLYLLGYSPLRIGEKLGRKQNAVYRKLRSMGVTKPFRRRSGRVAAPPQRRRHIAPDAERNPWHPARDPIPARYDWFHGARQEQTAV
jgi:hypothetical protein